ncbi:MAG: hypothetical protein AAF573_15980 [Bacteroidota bacterium]
MKDPKDLHTIIKSLTKAEKRIFKMNVGSIQKNNNNYTLLFDAIDAQEIYDEIKLQRKLKKHTFSKQISRTKYLLYEQILKVLRQLYGKHSERTKLLRIIESVDVLFSKTLYKQAYTAIKRAKKIAIANELFGLQQIIMDQEQRLLPYVENHKTITHAIKQLLQSYEQVAHNTRLENAYRTLHASVRLYYDTLLNFHEIDQIRERFDKIMQDRLMQNEATATTFLSKILFYEIHFLNAHIRSDFQKAQLLGDTLFDMWQQRPEMRMVFPVAYIRQLRDYTFWKISIENDEKSVQKLLDAWEVLPITSKEEAAKYALEINLIKVLIQVVNRSYTDLEIFYQQLKADNFASLKKLTIQQQITTFYHLAVYHFFEKRYAETSQLIEKVDALAGKKLLPHLLKYVRLMELIVRYESEEYEIEDKDILRIHRHLVSLGALGRIEKMLLQSIKKLMNLPILDEVPPVVFELKRALELNQHNLSPTSKTMSYQIIRNWVEDTISKNKRQWISA